jgi:hypothetical protein
MATTLWNSADQLSHWFSIISWLTVVAATMAVICAVAGATIGNRLNALRRQAAGPRRLSPAAKAALSSALDGKCPYTVPVSCLPGSAECHSYAGDFVEALRRGGCNASINVEARLKPDLAGVFIVEDKARSAIGPRLLAQALTLAQIEFDVTADSRLAGPDGFTLVVAGKPT